MKKTSVEILCDSCGKDIGPHLTNCPNEYILHVSTLDTAMHPEGQPIYSVMISPPIDNDLYFCGLGCMKSYGDKK